MARAKLSGVEDAGKTQLSIVAGEASAGRNRKLRRGPWATRDLGLEYETTQGSRCEAKTHINSAVASGLIRRKFTVPDAKSFSFFFCFCRFLV